jgi:peptidoglycan/xylan/chitin deacetylase (PgdA/CDA1 family)
MSFLGPCVRSIPGSPESKSLYLTFDDGPIPTATPTVLEVLERQKIKASFFVVGERAKENSSLLEEIKSQGHGVGNHSMDHQYRVFFQGKKKMLDWIQRSEELLADLLGHKNCGFRSPAGIRTPELHAALKELDLPLVHWRRRFFDTVIPWTRNRAARGLAQLAAGDIILLHEASCLKNKTFLKTLSWFVEEAIQAGFQFKPLAPELVRHAKEALHG